MATVAGARGGAAMSAIRAFNAAIRRSSCAAIAAAAADRRGAKAHRFRGLTAHRLDRLGVKWLGPRGVVRSNYIWAAAAASTAARGSAATGMGAATAAASSRGSASIGIAASTAARGAASSATGASVPLYARRLESKAAAIHDRSPVPGSVTLLAPHYREGMELIYEGVRQVRRQLAHAWGRASHRFRG